MYFMLFSLARKAWARRSPPTKPTAGGRPRAALGMAVLALLVTFVAFVLTLLCVFAGKKPGMLEEYSFITLNTSRIADNMLQQLDADIESIQLKRRTVPQPLQPLAASATTAPTTLITMAPRAVFSDLSSWTAQAGGDVSSAASNLEGQATAAMSGVESKATAVASEVQSAAASLKSGAYSVANSALGSVETNLVQLVDKAFDDMISHLELEDFYSLYVATTCVGTYVLPDGANITVGNGSLPVKGTHQHVDSCSRHSVLDPLTIISIFYWVGVILIGLTLCAGVAGLILTGSRTALVNIVVSLFAFAILGLASAVVHGLAIGAAGLVNFIGRDIGIAGYVGHKFLALTWAATVLLLVNLALWCALLFISMRVNRTEGPLQDEKADALSLAPS